MNNLQAAKWFYWFSSVGGGGDPDELNTLANATSPTDEVDATTGWSQYGLDSGANIFTSQSSVKSNGSYAIMASANDTPVSLARFWFDFAQLSLVEGTEYTVSFDIRAVGGGDSWRYGFSSGSNNDTTVTLDSVGGAETTFVSVSYDFTYGAAYRYIVFRESSGSNNGGFYIDNFSVKKKVRPVYASSEVGNVADNILVLTYDRALNSSVVPATTDFAVDDGAANAVTNVSIVGATVRLTLTNNVDNGDTVVVSYTGGTNKIQDLAGNEAVDLTTESVTNNVGGVEYLKDAQGNNILDAQGNPIPVGDQI